MNPSRIGYTFLGWDKTLPSTIPDHDLELNALWDPTYYTITLNSNGGTHISSISLMYDEEINIPTPTRSGYTFTGWTPTPPARMPAENLNLIAGWTQNLLTITFDANGGTNPSFSSKQVSFDSPYGSLPTTTRTGFTPAGWYTSITGGTKVETDTIVAIPSNHTLYARWDASHPQLEYMGIEPTNERNRFVLYFNNNITFYGPHDLPIRLPIRTNVYYYNGNRNQIGFNFNDPDENNYYIVFTDQYDQKLQVNLNLDQRRRNWNWSVTSTVPQ